LQPAAKARETARKKQEQTTTEGAERREARIRERLHVFGLRSSG
jgi:hypothetical protein